MTAVETTPNPAHFKSRRMIEAFRLGIVPHDCVSDFIFGRAEEIRHFTDWLHNPDNSSLMVAGGYGSGKTHLLHYIYGHARQEGFAVALIEMDPNESPFHRPKQVYRRFVQNLQFYDTESGQPKILGFRELIQEAVARGALEDHTYFKCLIDRRLDDTLWEWIEARDISLRPSNVYQQTKLHVGRRNIDTAERNLKRMEEVLKEVQRFVDGSGSMSPESHPNLPGLYPYYKAANIYCYLLSALGWAAQAILGLKGLLLIFDEAETVDSYDNLYQADKSQNFLKALVRTADSDDRLLVSPAETDLDYCQVGVGRSIPFLYKQPSGLKLLFAFTPIDTRRGGILSTVFPELQESFRINLESLAEASQKTLFHHVYLRYKSAYDDFKAELPADTLDAIFRRLIRIPGPVRMFVKATVETLDLIRTAQLRGLDSAQVLDEVL